MASALGLMTGVPPLGGGGALAFTATTAAPAQTVTLQRLTPSGGDAVVSWGDGAESTISDGNTDPTTHEYASAGSYNVTITNYELLVTVWIGDSQVGGNIGQWDLWEGLVTLLLDDSSFSGVPRNLPSTMTTLSMPDTNASGNVAGLDVSNLTYINFENCSGVTGDISGWSLNDGLTTIDFLFTNVSGNMASLLPMPTSMQYWLMGENQMTGDLSSITTFPTGLKSFYVQDNPGINGAMTTWAVNDACQIITLHGTALDGVPDLSGAAAIETLKAYDMGWSAAQVDAIIGELHDNRATFTGTPDLDIAAAGAQGQTNASPSLDGLRLLYDLTNDRNGEGFQTWTHDVTIDLDAVMPALTAKYGGTYWDIQDPSGSTITADPTTYNGTYSNVALNQAAGNNLGVAGSWNGSTSYGDVYSAALNTLFNGDAGTLMAFFRVSGVGVWTDGVTRYMFILYADSSNLVGLRRDNTNNVLSPVYVAGGTAKAQTIATGAPTDFFHYALTYDKDAGASGEFKAYLNGAQQGATQTGLGVWSGSLSSSQSVLGAFTTTPTFVWAGDGCWFVYLPAAATALDVQFISDFLTGN